ncbi:MAG: hypothetical protein ACRC33_17385 [Gemmataceae bacterium]
MLTEEQARAVAGTEAVDLRDPSGRLLAVVRPLDDFEAEALENHRRRKASPSPEPLIPAEQVHAHLLKLEEVRLREGGMTHDRMLDLLRRMRAGEEV